MTNTEKIAGLFAKEPLDYLGWWSAEKYRVDLYDVPDTPAMLAAVRAAVETVTEKFTMKVQRPFYSYTNIYIMDIDL